MVERFGSDRASTSSWTARTARSSSRARRLRDARAQVTTIGVEPDGTNINDGCGAMDLAAVSRKVVEVGADLGVAFDGDGDRVLAVDEFGETLDGDQILAISRPRSASTSSP